jgi:hypothetical protein
MRTTLRPSSRASGVLSCKGRSALRSMITRVQAPRKAEAATDFDRAERDRLEQGDAFAELLALNKAKQSVNKPQKVREYC